MRPGDIVLVKFPFSDLETSKKRPALVLVNSDLNASVRLVTLAMVTSKTENLKLPGDYLLRDWEKANLLHPSLVRLAKVVTVEFDLITKTLGRVSNPDLKSLQQIFKKQFQFWL